jgi:hypothetical protein
VRVRLRLGPRASIPEDLRTAPYVLKRRAGALGTAAILTVAMGLAGVSVGKRIALDIWSKFLLPKLILRCGLTATTKRLRKPPAAAQKPVARKRTVRKRPGRQRDGS